MFFFDGFTEVEKPLRALRAVLVQGGKAPQHVRGCLHSTSKMMETQESKLNGMYVRFEVKNVRFEVQNAVVRL